MPRNKALRAVDPTEKPARERKPRGPRKTEDDRLREICDRKRTRVLELRTELAAARQSVVNLENTLALEEPKLEQLEVLVSEGPHVTDARYVPSEEEIEP